MAVYGVDFYGTEFYGIAPYLDFDASPFTAVPVGYGALRLTWTPPTGDWDLLRVVRNSYGAPDFSTDGRVLPIPETSVNTREYLDINLREGNFYYYAVFVRESASQRWARAGIAIGLVTQNFAYGERMFRWIPGWFQEQDNARPRAPFFEGPLRRYLGVTGLAADFMRTELESLRWLRRPERISGNLLSVMAQQYAVPHEPAIGMRRTRFWLRDAAFLYSRKGTLPGIRDIITTITGWDSEVSYGPNILRGIEAGAWFSNADTTLANLLPQSDLDVGDVQSSITLSGAEWEIANAPLDGSKVRFHGIAVTPELPYVLRAEVRASTAADVTPEFEWYDEDGDSLQVDTGTAESIAGDNEWYEVSLPGFSPADAVFAVVRFRGDQSVEFARAQLAEGSGPTWTAPQMLIADLLPSRTNYVTNPSGELGVATWEVDAGSLTRSEDESIYGIASMAISGAATIATGGPYEIDFGVQHALRAHTTSDTARARIRWVDDEDAVLSTSDWSSPGDVVEPSWKTLTLSSFPPSGAVAALIDIEVEDGDSIDAVLLEAADGPGEYFDGDMFGADFIWSGNPHGSSSRFYPQRAVRNSRLIALLPDYMPVNQIVQLRYVVPESEFGGFETTPGTMGTDTLGIITLGASP